MSANLRLALDVTYTSIQYSKRNEIYILWRDRMLELGSYTFEMTILLERVIFTAEPANIKAVLATQFNDFGEFGCGLWTEGNSVYVHV